MLTEGQSPMYVYSCQPFTPQVVRKKATNERYFSFNMNRGYLIREAIEASDWPSKAIE